MMKLPTSQVELPGFSKPAEPFYLRNFEDVANHFGVHVQTIKNWSRKGMPKSGRGMYDVMSIRIWAISHGLIEDENIGYSSKIQKEKYLHEKAKRKGREFDLAIKDGKFIAIEDSKKVLVSMAQQIRMNLLALPSKMSPVLENLTAPQIQRRLEVAVDDILRSLNAPEK